MVIARPLLSSGARRFLSGASAVAALSAAMPPAVHAQTPSPLGEWQYSAGVPLMKLFEPNPPTWQVSVGAGMAFLPRYAGSDRYRLLGGPNVDVRYRDLFFLSTGEGLGANVLRGPNWRVSLSVGYDLGRRSSDDVGHLNGFDNINPAPVMKLSADYVISKDFPLVLRADVRRSLGGSNGWVGDLSAYMPLPGSNEHFFWFAGPTVSFADARYLNSWFGVSDGAAARSGLPRYSSGAGLKSVGAGVTMVWFVNKHWFLTMDGAIEQLVGRAAHSPVTQQTTNGVLDLSVNYQF
ncbi:structural protein MipA [Burkholderia stagnalis]|uniref:MipA/OmpV family protein n=1 Tax=Burkholderia stagnalis TaxID=1503054 RepID=A0A3P0CML3_9BURK|nr:MipA/OmpV family protein [Burkholderia stagnalis]AOK56252.1 structural protein MipA [Burkholderia stagnalis]KAB0639569.1 MipA/OmpV family protein [Burkholderia stagnalis]KVN11882.1 structural protein MipA [Burkholderia stagnalis]KVN26649.1 structural protein MipA [Burkholderia stagnalis]KVN69951.1 structural protein MipA [Burkholderia stagnalis]